MLREPNWKYPYTAGCYHSWWPASDQKRAIVSVHKTLESARKAALRYAKRVSGDIPSLPDGTLSWFGKYYHRECFAYAGDMSIIPCPLGPDGWVFHFRWRPAQLLE